MFLATLFGLLVVITTFRERSELDSNTEKYGQDVYVPATQGRQAFTLSWRHASVNEIICIFSLKRIILDKLLDGGASHTYSCCALNRVSTSFFSANLCSTNIIS